MFENLKALRLSDGKTQEEFAQQFGVKKTTYSCYETGISEPKLQFLIDVANRYAVTTDYLLGLSDDPHGTAHGGKTALEANYDALDAHGRREDGRRTEPHCYPVPKDKNDCGAAGRV